MAPDGALVNLRENAPFCRPERGAAPVRRVHYKRQRRASAPPQRPVAAIGLVPEGATTADYLTTEDQARLVQLLERIVYTEGG